MDNMIHHKFRTSAFGGFKRKDVAAYIESSSAEYNDRIKQLTEENDGLTARNDELSGMLLEMEQRLKTARASIEALTAEKDELAAMLEELTLSTAEPEEQPEEEPAEESVHTTAVTVPVVKTPKASVKSLLDSIKPEAEEDAAEQTAEAEADDGDSSEIVVETPEGKELLASIKIYYPRG